MKIYTKTGDKGLTSLLGGTRVSKSNQRLDAYGTIDELNSFIGLVASMTKEHNEFLLDIQHMLFNIGSILAAESDTTFPLPEISPDDVYPIENEIDRLNARLPELKNFILPGGSVVSAHTHVARCVCRRAERSVVALNDNNYSAIICYLNRLSDYLFVLSRDLLRIDGKQEVIWQQR